MDYRGTTTQGLYIGKDRRFPLGIIDLALILKRNLLENPDPIFKVRVEDV